jgi:hypothetical protein
MKGGLVNGGLENDFFGRSINAVQRKIFMLVFIHKEKCALHADILCLLFTSQLLLYVKCLEVSTS